MVEQKMTGNKSPSWFTDDSGFKSSGRVMAFVSLVAAVVIATGDLLIQARCAGAVNPDTDAIIYAFLGGAFGGKVAQKFAERK